jgi:hypothetical protein
LRVLGEGNLTSNNTVGDIQLPGTGEEAPVPGVVGVTLSAIYEALALDFGEIGKCALQLAYEINKHIYLPPISS